MVCDMSAFDSGASEPHFKASLGASPLFYFYDLASSGSRMAISNPKSFGIPTQWASFGAGVVSSPRIEVRHGLPDAVGKRAV